MTFQERIGAKIKLIADEKLKLADIPQQDADWNQIQKFALTYDGYKIWGSFEKCAEIANSNQRESLAELRTCLFFEQRRWHHFGDEPDDEAMADIRSLVDQIRTQLSKSA